jgi:hypothetical protein
MFIEDQAGKEPNSDRSCMFWGFASGTFHPSGVRTAPPRFL